MIGRQTIFARINKVLARLAGTSVSRRYGRNSAGSGGNTSSGRTLNSLSGHCGSGSYHRRATIGQRRLRRFPICLKWKRCRLSSLPLHPRFSRRVPIMALGRGRCD